MSAGGSAAARAASLRAGARRGVWRRVASWLGITAHTRRADAHARRWAHGAAGEATTRGMLHALERRGWHIRHDLVLPGRRFNLDHVLVSPCGTAVVVLDTKAWHRSRPTTLVRGRVHCGQEDRHKQILAIAGYARIVAAALALPASAVLPLVVVHGSPIPSGWLEVSAGDDTVLLVDPAHLVPSLAASPGLPDPYRAGALARHVFAVLAPYGRAR